MPSLGPRSDIENELERFIHHIAHDVRAAVRGLIKIPDWISEDLEEAGMEPPPAVLENLEFLKSRALRLDRMLLDLLNYSRIGSQGEKTTFDVADALSQCMDTVDLPDGFQTVGEFGSAKVHGVIEEVITLLDLLISNAIKHHHKEQGTITFSSVIDAEQVTLSIHDDGPGIDPSNHEQIFSPMKTLKPRDRSEGSGIGLAIAKKIVEQHDGTLRVISDIDSGGAEFVVVLPLSEP
jgi:signal transduction histidine kinase